MESSPLQSKPTRSVSRRFVVSGYVGIFLLAYFIFLIITFPYDLLTEGVLNKFKSRSPVPFEVERITPSLPAGFSALNLEIGPLANGKKSEKIRIDSLDFEASLIKVLFGKIEASADAKLYGGKIKLDYSGTSAAGDADFSIVSVDVGPLLKAAASMPWEIQGEIGGKGKLHLDTRRISENKGALKLNSRNLKAIDVDLALMRSDFNFSEAKADLKLERGRVLTVNSLALEGEPCGIEITGSISIQTRNPDQSQLNLDVIFKPTPQFEEQMPFSMLTKKEDGVYTGKLTGTFRKPSLR